MYSMHRLRGESRATSPPRPPHPRLPHHLVTPRAVSVCLRKSSGVLGSTSPHAQDCLQTIDATLEPSSSKHHPLQPHSFTTTLRHDGQHPHSHPQSQAQRWQLDTDGRSTLPYRSSATALTMLRSAMAPVPPGTNPAMNRNSTRLASTPP